MMMLGMLIVEDAEGEIPATVAALPERVVLFNHIHLDDLQDLQQRFNGDLVQV